MKRESLRFKRMFHQIRELKMIAEKKITGLEVVDKLMSAKTAGQKAAATRRKRAFLKQQEEAGKDPKWVEAGLAALQTRIENGNY